MSAQIISMQDFLRRKILKAAEVIHSNRDAIEACAGGRSPKPVTKKHAPRCRACRKPGHYYTTCDDAAALERFEAERQRQWKVRMQALVEHFGERFSDGEFTQAMRDIYPERMPGTPESGADHV